MTAELTISSDPISLYPVQDMIEEALQEFAYGKHEIFATKLAVEEALVNAIKHGNQMNPDKWVHIAYTVTPERFAVRITDEGPGFDYQCALAPPDPTAPHILERSCGRGLLLMRGVMTEVRFHGRGNVVSMSKARAVGS